MRKGFTIVELLIVVVVIGILAAISIVAFNGVQNKSRTAKIDHDLTMLTKAITVARINNSERTLSALTGSTGTSSNCVMTPANADLTDKATYSTCWSAYAATLEVISATSLINVRGLVDPWGWPYMIDENQGVGAGTCAAWDYIAVMVKPHAANSWAVTNQKNIPTATSCS